MKKYGWYLFVFLFAALVIKGGTLHPLWGDEAETALFARNINTYGIPKGWDGVNIMGITDAVVLNNKLINYTSPWGQYYLSAFSMKLFGESSFTARLPFIILSIVSIFLIYPIILKISKDSKLSLLTLVLASTSVPFILFSFQARYYSIIILGALLMFYSSLFFLESKAQKALFVISGIFFFYGNYLSFSVFWASLFISSVIKALILKEKNLREFIQIYLGLSVLIFIFCAPWYFLMSPGGGRVSFDRLNFVEFLLKSKTEIYETFRPFNQNNSFPFLFIPPIFYLVFKKIKNKKDTFIIIPFITSILFLLIMSALTVIFKTNTFFDEIRYTLPAFLFLLFIVSYFLLSFFKFNKWIGLVVFSLYFLTNIFTLHSMRSFHLDYLNEIMNPYNTPDIVVAKFLKENAKDGDTAFVSLDRNHEPLIFHLNKKIKFVNRVTPNNERIFPENREVLPKYLYSYKTPPDWVIMYGKFGGYTDLSFLNFDYRGVFPLGLSPLVNLENDYKEYVIPVFFADMSRPEIDLRAFSEVKPKYEEQVFIYKKIK